MEDFRLFLENSEASDIENTLKKIPKSHRNLVNGYSWEFQSGNTLSSDKDHIGLLDPKKKTITVAAPWAWSRELTFLHEIAHLVWDQLVPDNKKQEWNHLVKNTKMEKKDRQNPEELFSSCYGSVYSKHTPITYAHPQWVEFIKSLE